MSIDVTVLWLYVTSLSVLFGGALFERLVLVSAWASRPPQSVRTWNTNPELLIDPSRFFRFVSLPLMLLTPLECYLAFSSPDPTRLALLLSTITTIVMLIATLAYYFPTLSRLTHHQGKGLDDAQVVSSVRTWVMLQWVRLAMVAFAWLTALWAFRAGRA